ncbi:hypothetical protein NIES2119_07625 [[Phormidium ambiguum] IAM M-71]|uniref:Uncharacterized protein n=1 Tax=[Phormidium ambiguum] IAM M-71 TaxID=454136 RepID=A0A1U7INS2_9CYAN|nr:hypothetical protein [Phormidium ambiguum]OKH39001.1 hypothetical protein NIES2119_07625 [Phormidium ambiguum IAM M-71]
MPSSPGRYRSRLFNFVSRQTRRWIDRGERATRQVTIATVWGVQILVYPIYLLFQSARLAGKQLQHLWQGLSNPQPDLKPLPADTPIQKILETVKSLPLSTNLPESLSVSFVDGEKTAVLTVEKFSANAEEIQGIATLPENQRLVLVSRQNQILDILNQQQQQQLKKQISLELAEYLHHQRLVQEAKLPTMFLPPPASSENTLPPFRLLQQFMAWMQREKVAGVINLFSEETLQLHDEVKNRELQYRTQQLKQKTQELKERQQELTLRTQSQLGLELTSVPEVNDKSLLAKVDRAIATIETGSLVVASVPGYLVHHSREFSQLFKTRLQDSVTAETNYSPDLKLKIEVLIKAAVEYFFGTKKTVELKPKYVPENNSGDYTLETADPDFWLTEEELFPEPSVIINKSPKSRIQSHNLGLIIERKVISSQLNETNYLQKNSLTTNRNKLQKSSEHNQNDTTDAIEIQATSTGYIKHPLEQVLEILDRTMFFIEELLLTIWQEIQQLFK